MNAEDTTHDYEPRENVMRSWRRFDRNVRWDHWLLLWRAPAELGRCWRDRPSEL